MLRKGEYTHFEGLFTLIPQKNYSVKHFFLNYFIMYSSSSLFTFHSFFLLLYTKIFWRMLGTNSWWTHWLLVFFMEVNGYLQLTKMN